MESLGMALGGIGIVALLFSPVVGIGVLAVGAVCIVYEDYAHKPVQTISALEEHLEILETRHKAKI